MIEHRPSPARVFACLVVLALVPSAAQAQVDDHLKCYKVSDPNKFIGAVDLTSPVYGLEAGCKIKIRSVGYCTPVTKVVLDDGGAPVLPVSGPPVATDFLCYRVKCPAPFPGSQRLRDQFGERDFKKLRPKLLCAPAVRVVATTTTTSTVTSTTLSCAQPCSTNADCDDLDSCTIDTCVAGCCANAAPTSCATHTSTIGSFCCAPVGSTCVDPDGAGPLQVGDGQFCGFTSLDFDSSGNMYVADTGNKRVQKFDLAGNFVTKWGSVGSGPGQFGAARGITVDPSDDVYVSDTLLDRIQKFDSSGTFLLSWGSPGSANGEFSVPWALVASPAGEIFVADRGNHRVQKFDAGGTFLATWGSFGTANGEFNTPNSIAVDAAGDVYVADTGNSRVQKFDANGTFILAWGTSGSGPGQFGALLGITDGPCGGIATVEGSSGARVQRFDSLGTFIEQFGSLGTGPGQFQATDQLGFNAATQAFHVADTGGVTIDIQGFQCQ